MFQLLLRLQQCFGDLISIAHCQHLALPVQLQEEQLSAISRVTETIQTILYMLCDGPIVFLLKHFKQSSICCVTAL